MTEVVWLMGNRLAFSFLAACLALSAVVAAPPSSAGTAVYVPGSVAGDCSRDVTKDLNSWFASVPDGSTMVLGAAACYRVDGTLRLQDRRDLVVSGNGAVVRAMSTPPLLPKITRQMWLIRGGSNITLRDLTVQGTNPKPVYNVQREWLPLIEISGAMNVLVDHVTGRNSWGDFVFITPDVRRIVSSDGRGAVLPVGVTIRGSSASVIGRHAVTCNGCDQVLIDGNTFTDIGYQVLDIEVEALTWHARDITFSNNTIGGRLALSVFASGDNTGEDVSRVTLRANTMLTAPVSCAPPVEVIATRTRRSDFVITGNRFLTLSNAVRLGGITGAVVTGNTVTVSDAGCTNPRVAVVASALRSASVTQNFFGGATKLLVVTSGTVDGVICGNQMTVGGPLRPTACT